MSEKFGENIDTSSNSTTKKTSTEFLCGEKASAYVSKIEQQLNDGVITLSQYNESKNKASLLLDSQHSDINSLENKNQSEKEFIFGTCNAGKKELSTEVNNELELKKLKELGKYFGLSESEVQNIQNSLDQYQKESGMDLGSLKISNLLSNYKNYIESNLRDIDIQSKEKIIKSIGLRLNNLNTIISDIMGSIKEESGDNNYAYELKRERWNLNKSITDSFEFIDTQLLPTATLISKVNSGEVKLPTEKELYTSTSRGRRLKTGEETKQKLLLITAFKEGKELLSSDLNDEGNFESGFLGLFDDSGNILDSQDKGNAFFQKTGVDQTTFLADLGIQQIDSPSILNEKDRELEADVMIKYIAFIGTMMIPYVGLSTSLPSDFQDIISSSDGGISTMQMYGLIPDEFKMNNEWYDTAFGLMGVAGSMFGVQSVSKGPKMVKVMNRLSALGFDSAEVSNRVKACSHNLKQKLFGGKEPVESEISNIVSKKELSPDELDKQAKIQKDRIKKAEEKSGISSDEVYENANLSDFDRGVKSEELLGRSLSNEQKQVIIDIHNKSKGVYVERNAFGKDYDLNAMWNEAKSIFPDFSEFGLLVRHGILGKINPHDFLLGKAGEKLTDNDILRLLETGNYNYGGSFSADAINNELIRYGFDKISYDTIEELSKIHKINVNTSKTKNWFSEVSYQNLYNATNNPEINDLLIKFKQKPSSLTVEETELVLHIGEQVRGGNGQLVFDSKAEVEELRNRFATKEVKTPEEVSKTDINVNQSREKDISLPKVDSSSIPEKKNTGIQKENSVKVIVNQPSETAQKSTEVSKVNLNDLPRDQIIHGLNTGKIDIDALSYTTFVGVRNDWEKLFKSSPQNIQLEMLKAGNPRLFYQETLDRFLYFGIEEIQDVEDLIKIRSYLEPGGKFVEILKSYEFNIDRITGLLNDQIKGLKSRKEVDQNKGIDSSGINLNIKEVSIGGTFDVSGYNNLLAIVDKKPFNGYIDEFLESKGPELNFDELVLGYTYKGTDNLDEFNEFLDDLGKKGVSKEIFSELQIASNKVLVKNLLDNKNPTIKYEELKLFTDREDINQLFSILSDGALLKIIENDLKNLNRLSHSNINIGLLSPENLERLLSISKTTYEGNVWLGKMYR